MQTSAENHQIIVKLDTVYGGTQAFLPLPLGLSRWSAAGMVNTEIGYDPLLQVHNATEEVQLRVQA